MSENKIIEQVSIGGAITNLTEFFSAKNNGYSQGVPAGMNNLGAPAGYSHQWKGKILYQYKAYHFSIAEL